MTVGPEHVYVFVGLCAIIDASLLLHFTHGPTNEPQSMYFLYLSISLSFITSSLLSPSHNCLCHFSQENNNM